MTGGEPGWQESPEEPGRESSLEELRGYAEKHLLSEGANLFVLRFR